MNEPSHITMGQLPLAASWDAPEGHHLIACVYAGERPLWVAHPEQGTFTLQVADAYSFHSKEVSQLSDVCCELRNMDFIIEVRVRHNDFMSNPDYTS